jgi:hypothetical protein
MNNTHPSPFPLKKLRVAVVNSPARKLSLQLRMLRNAIRK